MRRRNAQKSGGLKYGSNNVSAGGAAIRGCAFSVRSGMCASCKEEQDKGGGPPDGKSPAFRRGIRKLCFRGLSGSSVDVQIDVLSLQSDAGAALCFGGFLVRKEPLVRSGQIGEFIAAALCFRSLGIGSF